MRITSTVTTALIFATALAVGSHNAHAQDPGSADTSYGPDGNGRSEYGLAGHYFEAVDVAIDAAGRAVVGAFGEVELANGTWEVQSMVLRFTAGGVLDVSFDSDGIQHLGIPPMTGTLSDGAVEIAADGGIWFGFTRAYCGPGCPPDPEQANFMVYKLSSSGFVEDSMSIAFDYGGTSDRVDDFFGDMAVLPDGRLAVVGTVERSAADDTDFAIAMVEQTSPGGVLALDSSWGGGGTATCYFDLGGAAGRQDEATAVAVEPSGSILVGGTAFVGDGIGSDGTDFALCRFSSTGGLQGTWHSASTGPVLDSREALSDLLVLGDGRILAAGTLPGDGGTDFAVLRMHSNLTADSSYGSLGTGWATVGFQYPFVGDTADSADEMLLDPDGGLVLSGRISGGGLTRAVALAKLTSAGALDTGWGIGGGGKAVHSFYPALEDYSNGIARQADGRYVAAGMTLDGSGRLFVLRMHGATGAGLPFSDGFESGDLGAWSQAQP